VPYLKKYKANPCTGQPLEAKGLIKLKYHKNAAGEYHCPVMYKVCIINLHCLLILDYYYVPVQVFNPSTHIAAIKTTGNVFCYEAIEELNLKTKERSAALF
jgi:peptidyl-prolyl cis-trans isomerase-like protein 2